MLNLNNMKMKNENSFPIQYIKGIGPKKAEALFAEGYKELIDLLTYFPSSYASRENTFSIQALYEHLKSQDSFFNLNAQELGKEIKLKSEFTLVVKIIKKDKRRFGPKKQLLSLTVSDNSGKNAKINFWRFIDFFDKKFKLSNQIMISGKPEIDKYGLSFTHPEIEVLENDEEKEFESGKIIPNYYVNNKLSKAGISNRLMRNVLTQVVNDKINDIKENLNENIINKYSFQGRSQTIRNLHFPDNVNELQRAKTRMKFEELFYYQLLIQKNRIKKTNEMKAPIVSEKSSSARKVFDNLPFKLTKDQVKVLNEIADDLKSGNAMNRLLQGDVGSGKTITSLLTMLMIIDSGYQSCILAPTEILAEQHYASIYQYLKDLDINICIVTSALSKTEKNKILVGIKNGEYDLIIGTHALFLNEIEFKNLAYIVIDEQHRFGVEQRAKLRQMAENSLKNGLTAHILVMSATPIPRTLEMTVYGDLDVSVIKTKPLGRKAIKTKVAFESNLVEVHSFIKDNIKDGRQAFIVYPLVEKSEKLDLKNAEEEFEKFDKVIFKDLKCALLHGRMKSDEKDFIMQKFKNKDYDILISTTVIEVGIDIPNANIMLIENAERFGLSQLHQLRGRVGRGEFQSYCILATKDHYKYQIKNNDLNESKAAAFRLKTMEETNDGFKIAEADLSLRGPGDLLGTKQSGLPYFKFANIVEDIEIIKDAKEAAIELLNEDPNLNKKENVVIKENIDKFISSDGSFLNIA